MDLMTDYGAYRIAEDRAAELRREADAFRLTRVLAQVHTDRFPQARRLGAGLAGLGRTASRAASSAASRATSRPAASPRGRAEPCPC